VADGTIIGVGIANGFTPMIDTPIVNMDIFKKVSTKTSTNISRWESKVADSNYLETIRRMLITQKVLAEYFWPSSDLDYEFMPIMHNLENLFEPLSSHDVERLMPDLSTNIPSALLLENTVQRKNTIELELYGEKGYNEYPYIEIFLNQLKLFEGFIEGQQLIKLQSSSYKKRNILKIKFLNKKFNDTNVKDNKIIFNKSIKIKDFKIDDIRIHTDDLYQLSSFKSEINNYKTKTDGLYENGTFSLYFTNPLLEYFSRKNKFFFTEQNTPNLLDNFSKLFNYYTQQNN